MKLTFSQLRQASEAIQKAFKEPVIEPHEEEQEGVVEIYALLFLAIIGAVTIVYFIGVAVINLV